VLDSAPLVFIGIGLLRAASRRRLP
jgi:hypothetical protein